MCDVCQSTEFVRRKDDKAETVRERLMVYYRETSPLIGYYFCKGILRTVDGMGADRGSRQAIASILDAALMTEMQGLSIPPVDARLRCRLKRRL